MITRRHAVAALGAAAASPLAAPLIARATEAPTSADLRGDVAILRQALALHPGLYRYATPAQIEARLGQFESEFITAATPQMRYLLLSRFLAAIRCGHSYANFFNQKKAIAAALFDRQSRLPYHFRWIGGKMIVTADHSGMASLPPGTEVRTINGVRAGAMLSRLMPYVRADGHNDAKRISLLEVTGSERIETFDVFHGLIYGMPADGRHRLDVCLPGARETTIDVPVIDLATRRSTMTVARKGDEPLWSWTMRSDGVALLTMPDWATYNSKWPWRAWLDERLGTLAGAKGLIIDLRANEGGEDCGNPIIARLAKHDIAPDRYDERLRFQRTPANLDRYLDTWDDSFRTLGVGGTPLANGFFTRPNSDAIHTISAVSPRLSLPTAVLIGPANSSATFQFVNTLKTNRIAKLFGTVTGGNRRGINGGCFFFVRLPASELEFDLPLVGSFARTPQPDAGLNPDVIVAATAGDIAAGNDPVMATALAWISRA